jgi:two-component system nitrate/nitrite response regulator NarL
VGINSSNRRSQGTVEVQPTPTARDLIRKLTVLAVAAAPTADDRQIQKDGNVFFSADVDGVRCLLAKATPEPGHRICFSPREGEIARMVAKGYPNKMIAEVLDISVWTVGTHLRRIFGKLGVNSRAAMVAQMSTLGLLETAPLMGAKDAPGADLRLRRPAA